jgi:dihydrofolate reductase
MYKKYQTIISAIAAMAENRVIGKNNQLPWHLPADLTHFKTITTGNCILMGRKTYESIGKPLPNRTNIILTQQPEFAAPGCIVVNSFEEALTHSLAEKNKELIIIGGAQIYTQLLPQIERIYLTIIHHLFDGDVFFPELDTREWHEAARETHRADEKNKYAYSFTRLERIKSK